MTEYKYDVWTKPSVAIADEHDARMEWAKLEGMVFANPAAVGDIVCLAYDTEKPLWLGTVEAIKQFPAFNGRNATTRLVLERRVADEDRFQKFVETYGSRRQIE
ncbi:MAG: hypothetical protein WC852_06085 [Candidatus Nanoarchaeia archaeon]|jgi:hypothetical protein